MLLGWIKYNLYVKSHVYRGEKRAHTQNSQIQILHTLSVDYDFI